MIIQRAGVFKFFRYLGIFCALTMGFFSIVATSEDDVKDALAVDFSEDVTLETPPVEVEKVEVAPGDAGPECETMTVNEAIDLALAQEEIDFIDYSDVDDIILKDASITYSATWVGDFTKIKCELKLTGPKAEDPSATISDIAVSGETNTLTLDNATKTVIQHYLDNPDKPMTACYTCTDDPALVDSYIVTFVIKAGTTIEGEYFPD